MSHSDLVTRLRAMATGGWSHLPSAKTAGEAADEIGRLRELLTTVAESGVEWSTPGYVLVQIDRATWSAITAAPTPPPVPAVSGFDFPPEGA